ncbi:MAG TPA: hypothetical protein VIV66_23080 [Pyrinomonadaceae bacterium]
MLKTKGTTEREMRLMVKLMRFAKQISWAAVTKWTWVYVGLGILLLGLGTFLVEPDGTVAFRQLMPFMLLLSFPAGVAAFLVVFPFMDVSPAVDFSVLWFVAFLAGYFQWFHVVPNLRSQGFVSLSLSQCPQSPAPAVAEKPERLISNPKVTKRCEPRVIHFDAAGRTPLERVIYFTPPKRSTRTK